MTTASDIYDYLKCPHRVFLNYHGDPSEKSPLSPFLELLFGKGVKHEKKIIGELVVDEPAGVGLESRFASTLELMRQGVPLIYQGVLVYGDYIGRPDLLERQEGESSLGQHYYRPIDIKRGRGYEEKTGKLRKHYGLQLAFYAKLLEQVQGTYPQSGQIWNIHGESVDYPIEDFQDELEELLPEVSRLRVGDEEDEPARISECQLCHWEEHCNQWLEQSKDISLVVGIGRSFKNTLGPAGYRKISDVPGWSIKEVVKLKNIGEKRAETWQRQAEAQVTNQMTLLEKPSFKDAPLKIYFDFEDDPTQNLIYHYGLLIEDEQGSLDYRYFFADGEETEERAWQDFISFCESLMGRDFVVYHYHHHEEVTLNSLAEKYPNFNRDALDNFKTRMEDLLRVVKKSVVLPLQGYGLKPLSQWLGFTYSSPDAGGTMSICWFNQYQDDPAGNAHYKDIIIQYNREDCEATKVVKDWLTELKQSYSNSLNQ